MQDTLHITGIEPLIAPEQIPFWPPAPGWFILSGLLLLVLLFLLWLLVRTRRRNRYRTLALFHLAELNREVGNSPGSVHLLKLNRLIKGTALAVFPRERVASLYGKDWLFFLQNSCTRLNSGDLSKLKILELSLREKSEASLVRKEWDDAVEATTCWIKYHTNR